MLTGRTGVAPGRRQRSAWVVNKGVGTDMGGGGGSRAVMGQMGASGWEDIKYGRQKHIC